MVTMLPQDPEEHQVQLAETVRHIFPILGYTQEGIDRFIETPDRDTDEGEFYRIETAPNQAVLAKVRGTDTWEIA